MAGPCWTVAAMPRDLCQDLEWGKFRRRLFRDSDLSKKGAMFWQTQLEKHGETWRNWGSERKSEEAPKSWSGQPLDQTGFVHAWHQRRRGMAAVSSKTIQKVTPRGSKTPKPISQRFGMTHGSQDVTSLRSLLSYTVRISKNDSHQLLKPCRELSR